MLQSAAKWLSWLCVFLAIVFTFCGFAAVMEWFDRDLASMLARFSAYGAFLVGASLIGCLLFDYSEE